ncbi:Mob1/phocein family protein [Entamoeba marina]
MFKKTSTIKPKKKIQKGTLRYDMHKLVKEGVASGDLIHAVKLAEGQNLYEWLSVNCFDFVETLQLIYSSVSDFCNETSCPQMSAGPSIEYLWIIDKKPTSLSAQRYCEELFFWVNEQFDNNKIFPDEFTDKPPRKFMEVTQKIFKRLFRVYAHMFYSHMEHLKSVSMDDIALQGFKHFYFFCREFKLLTKEDFSPLEKMIEDLCSEAGVDEN